MRTSHAKASCERGHKGTRPSADNETAGIFYACGQRAAIGAHTQSVVLFYYKHADPVYKACCRRPIDGFIAKSLHISYSSFGMGAILALAT
jgi:hypothetical protein